MKRVVCVLAVVFLSLNPVFAQTDVVVPGDNLVAENIPAIPTALADEVNRYTDFRFGAISSWHQTRREMLIITRFADTDHEAALCRAGRKRSSCAAERVHTYRRDRQKERHAGLVPHGKGRGSRLRKEEQGFPALVDHPVREGIPVEIDGCGSDRGSFLRTCESSRTRGLLRVTRTSPIAQGNRSGPNAKELDPDSRVRVPRTVQRRKFAIYFAQYPCGCSRSMSYSTVTLTSRKPEPVFELRYVISHCRPSWSPSSRKNGSNVT